MNTEQKKALQLLKTARGQIEGTIKMIEEERYCIDVSNQILASQSLLKKANMLILKQHLNHCIKEAFRHENEQDGQAKINEIINIISKITGK
jgi:DNA-binding FrmR family transcriptional regulator